MASSLNVNDESLKSLASASAVAEVMAKVTPDINNLLEENITSISDNFTEIASSGRNLQSRIEASGDKLSISEIKSEVEKINKSVANAIIGLQFQDRLSQNLVILQDISQEIKSSIENTLDKKESKEIDIELSKTILSLLKLGTIRDTYIEYLISKGFIDSPEDLGYHEIENEEESDIELF